MGVRRHGRRLKLPVWLWQDEAKGVLALHDWLCPMVEDQHGEWRESGANLRHISECERIIWANGFRRYWRDVRKSAGTRGKHNADLLLAEVVKQLVYLGGALPDKTPSARRKQRLRLLERALTRVAKNDPVRAQRILRSDAVLAGIVSSQRADHCELDSSILAVYRRLKNGEELLSLEAGPVAPIGVQPGRSNADALKLERALRVLFIKWTGRPSDKLVDRGRRIALGERDPFWDRTTTPSDRFRGSAG